MQKKSNGFSLLEILITVSLLLIIASFAVANFSFFDKFLLNAETSKLFSVLTYQQQKAIASGKQKQMQINIEKNCFIFDENGKNIVEKLNDKVIFGFIPDAKGPPSSPTKPITSAITFAKENENFVIKFAPDGKINCGTIYLTSKNKKFMAAISTPISQVSLLRKYVYKVGRWELIRN
ncbi:TPA: hypothetical protein DEO28_04425 [Candidatus Dependentiae bacterium]|nr:MAG: General secretion pathway protein H [candidate division TM6 bacterium GW2011_GWE2_31_21]KKP53801.1 MAG: General secretion pathway protein H [candidate division TM6 bacterium GW2011_GWF2_33_332]HBS47581.1 hypothetical protein [Candidatus Dependentiae bacterium]HBZ73730.1 hypothetical protein [Candidatus Dependentiae bacterium]